LHIDDIEVLNFIQKTLGLGKIYESGKLASFVVSRQEDIKKIIEIFSNARAASEVRALVPRNQEVCEERAIPRRPLQNI
jgi:hypothetical protein